MGFNLVDSISVVIQKGMLLDTVHGNSHLDQCQSYMYQSEEKVAHERVIEKCRFVITEIGIELTNFQSETHEG